MGDEYPHSAIPCAEPLLEERLSVFLFHCLGGDLPPYVFSGAYALKLALTGETYGAGDPSRNRDIAFGALATVYGLWLVYAAGLQYLLMCAVLFAPGIAVYDQAPARAASEPSPASKS
jgi:hypothetical protein